MKLDIPLPQERARADQGFAHSQPKPPVLPPALEALPGSTPRPYHTHRTGECQFILGESADMADALTCCAPVKIPEDGKRIPAYCETHRTMALSKSQTFMRKPATANELIRSLRKFL